MVSSKILRFFPGDWGFFIPRIFKFNNSENFYTRGIVTDSKFFQKSIKKFWYHADDSWLSAESGLGLDFSGIHNPRGSEYQIPKKPPSRNFYLRGLWNFENLRIIIPAIEDFEIWGFYISRIFGDRIFLGIGIFYAR